MNFLKQSKEIEQQLREDAEKMANQVKLLLLGKTNIQCC
jgi:hypothetical protein